MMALNLSGKVVAVSGGAAGFGKAICDQFAAGGAKVYACDIHPRDPTDAPPIPYVLDRVDLTHRDAATGWIKSVEARVDGQIDVLVCNAGGVAGQLHVPFEDVGDEDWNDVLAINLDATFALCRAAVPAMKRTGGAIVTITSGAALQASLTGVQAYCTAKHAVLGLTRQLAHELGPFGIRVNSVAPGFVLTPATERQWATYDDDRRRGIIASTALRRLGTPREVASVTLFLASDLSSYVNGQILSVDGGK